MNRAMVTAPSENPTPKRVATVALIGGGIGIVLGTILVKVGVAKRHADMANAPNPTDIAPNGYSNAYNAGETGLAIANTGEKAIFGSTEVACASIGAMIGQTAGAGWLGAGIGAGIGAVVGVIPSVMATMILSGDTGTSAQ